MKNYLVSLCACVRLSSLQVWLAHSFVVPLTTASCLFALMDLFILTVFFYSPLGSSPAPLCTSTQPFYCPEGMKPTEVKVYSGQYNLLSALVLVRPKPACGVQMLANRCVYLLKKLLHSWSSFISRSLYCEESFRLPQLQVTQCVWMLCMTWVGNHLADYSLESRIINNVKSNIT